MRIAVTGASGKIGRRLASLGALILDCDVTNRKWVADDLYRVKPDVIIHAAAVSSIQACYDDYDKAVSVNVWGTNTLAEIAYGMNMRTILLSSDQVFNGRWGRYKETDKPKPIHNYGITKLAAEGIVQLYEGKIIRLSRGVSWQDRDLLDIANNAGNIPTFIKRNYCHLDFVAVAIMNYAKRYDEMPQILHYGGMETFSFYDFAKHLNPNVKKRRRDDKRFSPRPFNCGFDISLARKLNLPIFPVSETIKRLKNERL